MKSTREMSKRRDGDRPGSARRSRGTATEAASSRRARTRSATTSTPGRETKASRSGPQTSPITRPVERSARPKSASQAKARSKARKAKAPKVIRPRLSERLATRLASIDLRPRTIASKVPFVVLVIGALGIGLGLTLWLSTDAAERSYQLSHARETTRMLQQQKEALERDVRQAESAPALAEAARKQGMIPTRDTAHLVQDATGNWVVVGVPKPADGVPPPPLNSRLPDENTPPATKQPAAPPEVPVLVAPAPRDPAMPPKPSGPEALLRAPDGSTTVGGQHLTQTTPGLPGTPDGQGGQVLGTVPQTVPQTVPLPGLPIPAAPTTPSAPTEVSVPLGGLPLVIPTPVPAQQTPTQVLPQTVAPVPGNGEQFSPVTTPTPGAPR